MPHKDPNTWTSCLQALALSPRSETADGSRSNSRSPLVSPRASPQSSRRPPITGPPPVPPRRASPTNTPGLSPGTSPRHQNVHKENDAVNGTTAKVNISTQDSPDNSGVNVTYSDVKHDNSQSKASIQRNTQNNSIVMPTTSYGTWPRSSPTINQANSSSSLPPSTAVTPSSSSVVSPSPCSTSSSPPLSRCARVSNKNAGVAGNSVLHYAELAEIKEEPNYANTDINIGHGALPIRQSAPEIDVHTQATSSFPQNNLKMEKRIRSIKPLGISSLENKENDRVSYENLHMDYIAELTSEGYAQDAVIRALGIARNDLQMARDILHEFVTKRK